MLSREIVSKIKQIEITTKRMLQSTLVGDHRSAQKGTGLEFDQIRDYQQGDDVRFIDWKSSARMNKVLVKEYIEERSRTIILAVDVSASTQYQSTHSSKADIMAQIAGVLSFVADCGNDYVGLLLFSDQIHHYLPPKRGRKHVHHIMQILFSGEYQGTKTDISCALEHLIKIKKKNAVVFFLSDFIGTGFEKLLSVVARLYDLIAIRCNDRYETTFPQIGMLELEDLETGEHFMLDTNRQKTIMKLLRAHEQVAENILKKNRVDVLHIKTHRPFVGDIVQFLKQRMQY